MIFNYCLIFVLTVIAEVLAQEPVLIAPCKDLSNACVGWWLSQHAQCEPVSKIQDLDPYYYPFTFDVENPSFNVTHSRYTVRVDGLKNGGIENFFINTQSKQLVLTLYFDHIQVSGRENLFFHQLGDEDVTVDTAYRKHYYGVHLTTIFKMDKNFKVNMKTAWTNSRLQRCYIDINDFPEVVDAMKKHPVVYKTTKSVLANLNILGREEILYSGKLAANAYIQNALCQQR